MAYAVPGSIRLKYNVLGTKDNLNYSARAEMLWLQDGSTYEARLEVSAFLIGSRTRTSTGRLGTEGLLPTRFSDKFRSEVAAHFEREKGKVSFSANTPDAPLLQGMQDQLSVFVQIGAMLAGAPARYPAGTVLTPQGTLTPMGVVPRRGRLKVVGIFNLVPLLPLDGGHIAIGTYQEIVHLVSKNNITLHGNGILVRTQDRMRFIGEEELVIRGMGGDRDNPTVDFRGEDAVISAIIGLIEGIIYLTKTDEEFVRIYVDGRKEWF